MRNYMYILVMAVTTYMIRVIPLTLLRKEIKNRTFRSFLTYVPYVTLSVMTFPAILESTEKPWISFVGFGAAMVMTDYSDRPMKEQKIRSITVDTFGVEYPEPETSLG